MKDLEAMLTMTRVLDVLHNGHMSREAQAEELTRQGIHCTAESLERYRIDVLSKKTGTDFFQIREDVELALLATND